MIWVILTASCSSNGTYLICFLFSSWKFACWLVTRGSPSTRNIKPSSRTTSCCGFFGPNPYLLYRLLVVDFCTLGFPGDFLCVFFGLIYQSPAEWRWRYSCPRLKIWLFFPKHQGIRYFKMIYCKSRQYAKLEHPPIFWSIIQHSICHHQTSPFTKSAPSSVKSPSKGTPPAQRIQSDLRAVAVNSYLFSKPTRPLLSPCNGYRDPPVGF